MNVAKDPVCGMSVLESASLKGRHGENVVYFCSTFCKSAFEQDPAKFASRLVLDKTRETKERTKIAYFSMEVALGNDMHTYAGGLGVLAGDTLRSAADLCVPMVGLTLLCREGYLRQELDEEGGQREADAPWDPKRFLSPLSATAEVELEGRRVMLTGWEYQVVGVTGFVVPVIFLDTDLDGNADFDRRVTDRLYGGDERYRLAQECVLGIGGVRILEELGYESIERYHMNEGHASLLVLELLQKRRRDGEAEWDFEGANNAFLQRTHRLPPGMTSSSMRDVEDLYRKLDEVILPLFHGDRAAWLDVMRRTIAFNASYFNTHRMVQQYVTNAYVG